MQASEVESQNNCCFGGHFLKVVRPFISNEPQLDNIISTPIKKQQVTSAIRVQRPIGVAAVAFENTISLQSNAGLL